MELIVAILAGICPDWWPFGPRRRLWPRPIPPIPPRPDPGDPPPILPQAPGPDPWTALGGILCGAGGAIAWLAVGPEFRAEGSLLAPVIIGFLGGTAAGWAVDSARDLTRSR